MHFLTHTVHAGEAGSQAGGPSTPSIERAASWAFETMAALDAAFEGAAPAYYYGRDGMPTPALLEEALASLTGGPEAVVFATGMAAIAAALAVSAGQRVLATPDLYGKTYHLLNTWLPATGVELRFASAQDQAAIATLLEEWRPHLLVVETVSNPLVRVSNVAWLVERAHAVGCRVLVDNTFASPYLCQPAALGADYSVESLTKYINGHGDVLGGVVTANDAAAAGRLRQHRATFGATLDPQAAWLALRGLRTLGLRMRQHCANAAALAQALAAHPAVHRVYYPGLPTAADHALAGRLFGGRGYGGMLAFDLHEGTRARAWAVMDRLRLARRAPTLGEVATLVSYPAHASHRALTPAQRAAAGIGDGLIRVSAGIEYSEDIVADFIQALA